MLDFFPCENFSICEIFLSMKTFYEEKIRNNDKNCNHEVDHWRVWGTERLASFYDISKVQWSLFDDQGECFDNVSPQSI